MEKQSLALIINMSFSYVILTFNCILHYNFYATRSPLAIFFIIYQLFTWNTELVEESVVIFYLFIFINVFSPYLCDYKR